ncbi:MAG TPA: cyclic nucleotide-binding domain-containing protein [Candidatus Limnocylindrales bacterium]|jgi:CRP/FNR family cyclic AMP-dependent transcriptional regulator
MPGWSSGTADPSGSRAAAGSRRGGHKPRPGTLAETRFGARLPLAAQARLEPQMRIVEYAPGAEILREGDPTDVLGIVRRGRAAVRLRVPERGPTTILTVEPGDILGWSAVVPPHRATSTVVALQPTEVLSMPGAALRAELEADPLLAAAVYRALLEALSRRLIGTRMQLLDLFTTTGADPW